MSGNLIVGLRNRVEEMVDYPRLTTVRKGRVIRVGLSKKLKVRNKGRDLRCHRGTVPCTQEYGWGREVDRVKKKTPSRLRKT